MHHILSQDSDSDSPLSRALRACRAHESHDGFASDAVVTDADGAADADVAADAGGAGGAGGAGLRPRRRIWRTRRDANAARKKESLTECVKAVSSRLGRVGRSAGRSAREKAVGRFRKAGSLTPDLLVELAFGPNGDELLQKPLLKADKAAISCGLNVRTARRARALVLDAMANDAEKALRIRAESEFHGKPIARGYKFSWDEMALRFYVPQGFDLR